MKRQQPLSPFALLLLFLSFSDSASSQVVAVGETQLLAAWSRSSDGQWRLHAATSDFGGSTAPARQLSENSFPSRPAVATDGERFLVVWPEVVNGRTRVQATIHGAQAFTIADGVNLSAEDIAPVALWSGSRYVVFWQTLEGTDMALVSATGLVESTRSIAGIGRVVSAAIGSVPVLLWMERPLDSRFQAAFLGSDWNASDLGVVATVPVSTGGGSTFLMNPQIVWNGSSFYVTWSASRAGRYAHIEGTRLSVDGRPLDTYLTCEYGPLGTCGSNTHMAGSLIYSGCCEIRTDALLAVGPHFVKSWVGPSLRASHEYQASRIDGNGLPSAAFSLERPRFPPTNGTLIALPHGELAIVRIVNNAIQVQRIGGTRRRVVRPS